MAEELPVKDKAAFYALLAKHNARPSSGGEEWAKDNWFNLESVTDRISSLQHETKFKLGKNKTILCSVLGACLTAAVETRFKRRSEENTIIDSLQSLVKILQNENHLLQAALIEERAKNLKHADLPNETEEKETPHIKQIYPQKELVLVKNCGEHCCPSITPLVKAETLVGTPKQSLENIYKAACLQMIHDDSPMQLPVKPEIMIPLIQKPLELLKPIAIVSSFVEKLDSSLGNLSEPTGSTDRGFSPYPTPSQPPAPQSNSLAGDCNVYVLSEIAVELTNYVKTPSSEKSEKRKQITSCQHLLLLDIKNGVPKENLNLLGQPLTKKSQPSTHLSSENLGSEPRNNLTIRPTALSPSQQSLPSRGNRHSPTLAHPALAQELEKIPITDNVAVYQCTNDISVGRDEIQEMEDTQQKTISNLESFDLNKHDKHVITFFDQIKMPESTKELQQVSELLVLCRKHIPDFAIIAKTLYSLLRKGKIWEWGDSHQEIFKLLIFEATVHQTLGPTYPTDPFQMEWGFSFSGLSVQQPIALRAPFNAVIPYSTPPPDRVAKRASVGAVKNVTMNLDGSPDKPASVTETAPPFCPKQSHLTAKIVPDWAKCEKTKWATYTYCGWEANKCSKITAFCPAVPSINMCWIIPSY